METTQDRKKAWAYCRISNNQYPEKTEKQIEKIEHYCMEHGIELVGITKAMERSGDILKRSSIQEVIQAVD